MGYWTTPSGARISDTSDGNDEAVYQGQKLNAEQLAEITRMSIEMQAVIRVLDVTPDVARKIVLEAHATER